MKRLLIFFALVLVLLVGGLLGLRWWVTQTESGARYLIGKVQEFVPGTRVERVEGELDAGLTLEGVSWGSGSRSAQIESMELRAGLRLLPRPAVNIRRLHIERPRVLAPPSAEPAEPAGFPDIASPVPVIVEDFRVRELSLLTAVEGQRRTIPEIRAELRYGEDLELISLRAHYRGLQLRLDGRAALAPPYAHTLSLQIEAGEGAPAPLAPGFRLDAGSSGSLDELTANLQTHGDWPLAVQITAGQLMDQPRWRLRASSRALAWPPAQADIALRDLRVRGSGGLEQANADVSLALLAPRQLAGDWSLQLEREGATVVLRELTGPLLAGSLRAEAQLYTAGEALRGQARVELADIKPAQGELPAGLAGVEGELRLGLGDSRLTLEHLDLAVPGSAWRLTGSGGYGLDSGRAELALDWRDLAWPPGDSAAADYASPEGKLRLRGVPDAYELSLQGRVDGEAVPAIALRLEGSGNRERLSLEMLRLDTLDGRVTGTGSIELVPHLQWQASLAGESINPGAHWPEFPGEITFAASSDGGRGDAGWRAALELQRLSGQLRGRPLSGSGRVSYRGGELHTEGLEIESASARLRVREQDEALLATVNVGDLGDLVPAAGGSLEAEARLARRQSSAVEMGLAGGELDYRGWRVQRLTGSGFWQADGALQAGLKLLAGSVGTPDGRALGDLEISADSDDSGQRLEVGLHGGELQFGLAAAGRFDRWPAPRGWRGAVEQLRLEHSRFGAWALADAASLRWRPGRIEAQPLCLAQTQGAGSICASGAGGTGSGSARLELSRVPLQIAGQLAEPAMRFDSTIGGEVEVGWDAGLQRLDTRLEATPGTVSIAGEQTPPLKLTGALVTTGIHERARLHTRADLRLEDGNRIHGEVLLGPLDAAGSPPLAGRVGAEIEQLALLRRVIPELDELAGSLELEAQLAGTVAEPEWAPRIELRQGRLRYVPLGLRLSELRLSGNAAPGEPLALEGGFRAGDGRGDLHGRLDPANGTGRVELSGDGLQLLDSKAYKLTASPDLAVEYTGGEVRIDGRLDIPSADIKPRGLNAQTVQPSSDVVLVGAETPPKDDEAGLRVHGELAIGLGDNVRVDMDLARARLAGELALRWSGPPVPDGDGEIRLLSGGVRAYGQTLDIKRGQVVFADTPVDNPRLDIRAARDIFSDPQVTEAGVEVTGSARNPEIALYTEPPTSRESALAYVVTGNNFDHANGEGALNVGLYLFPKFFVSYGFGLFDNGDVISGRYDLDDNWSIRAQSGARDTGVDIGWRGDG